MACDCESLAPLVIPPTHVFTNKSDSSENTIPLTAPFPGTGISRLLVRAYVGPITGNISLQLYYEKGDDPFNMGTGGDIGSAVTSEGWVEEAVTGLGADLFYLIGIKVVNTTGTSDAESAYVQATIQPLGF